MEEDVEKIVTCVETDAVDLSLKSLKDPECSKDGVNSYQKQLNRKILEKMRK